MLTDQERLDLLLQAEQNITKVRESLNDNANSCGCCGLTVYENIDHHYFSQFLQAAFTKVHRVREGLMDQEPAPAAAAPASS